ncbi:MAG: cytochrome c [Xanthomonadaceae bacterium]|jgi:mono/diheme cytochrome c family protein|nr:cytochrome c [Xanthomonadaceae bacterium]
MPFVTRKSLLTLSILSGVALAAAAGFVWSGIYNIGADDTHTRPVYSTLQALRERSIEVRANKLQVPADLDDPARIRQGAGNYNAMCTGCHLGPGMQDTELSMGLYPAPPNLSKETVDADTAFWVIKHGIKASGMPAWGKSMDDEYIWNMAAFLQALPKLTPEQYQALVASSGGHSHGGGESEGHAHAEGGEDHHDEGDAHAHTEGEEHNAMAGMPMDAPKPHSHPSGTPPHVDAPKDTKAPSGEVHIHADGKKHVHDAKPTATPATAKPTTADPHAGMDMPETEPASDGHDHQH